MYLQQHLGVPKMPMTMLARNTVGHLPITSNDSRWVLMAICLQTSYVLAVPMKTHLAENVVQAYLSGILTHKGQSVTILSDNGTEFKNKMLNKVCHQLGIKRLFVNPFQPQGNAKVENIHTLLKRTLTKFLDNNSLEWGEILPITCYVIIYFQVAMVLNPHFFPYVSMRSSRRTSVSP